MDTMYMTEEAKGDNWEMWLGDSCERMTEIPDDSIGLSVSSPPFVSLYTYSDSLRDLSNNSGADEFHEQYGYIIRELLRTTMPGRLACVHCTQLTRTKATYGYRGIHDFRGDLIRDYESAGWIYFGEVVVWKNPQVQAIRTKSQDLMFVTLAKDSSLNRPAIPDYLLIFKKPEGDGGHVPVKNDVTQDEWIDWASPTWADSGTDDRQYLKPVWERIVQTDTLNERIAFDKDDEKHISPLQLDFIERCIRLYSNPGEIVFDPFAGIGSTPYVALKLGRKGFGIELKKTYYDHAVRFLTELERDLSEPTLFDGLE